MPLGGWSEFKNRMIVREKLAGSILWTAPHGLKSGDYVGTIPPENKKGLQPKKSKTLDISGAPDRIRTCGLRIRSPLLYPAELQAQQKDHLTESPGKVQKKIPGVGSYACECSDAD
jgi:hypothetical protein